MIRTLDGPWLAGQDGAETVTHLAERQLLAALERTMRGASRPGWALLVVHLSRLPPPGPRPYHHRLTAALLDETAGRCTGQVFALSDGDLALLFRPPDDGAVTAALVARLFEAEQAESAPLHELWPLPEAGEAAVHALHARLRGPAAPPRLDDAPPPRPSPDPPYLQTAIRLRAGTARRITPLFRELVTPAVRRLDRPTLEAVVLAMARSQRASTLPLHLNLTPACVMSEPFSQLVPARETQPMHGLAVAIAMPDVLADPETFMVARERLRLAGMRFVLDQVDHAALRVSRAQALGPEWIKLRWHAAMTGAGIAGGLAAAIAQAGPDRIVLSGCDAEAALVWGLQSGIQRFQGPFVEAMMAAERHRACPAAAACRLAQCRDRAGSIRPEGRAGCRNLPLLDAATPPAAPPAAPPSTPPSTMVHA